MLQIIVAVVMFFVFFNRASKAGRSSFGWGLLGATIFFVCSTVVSTIILRMALPSLIRGSSGGDAAAAAFLLAMLGNAVGLGAALLVLNRSLPHPPLSGEPIGPEVPEVQK